MDEASLHAILREYLEGDVRRENRELRRDLSLMAERMARMETIQGVEQAAARIVQAAQHQDLTDTQRMRMTAQGIQLAPGWGPPPSVPPRKHSDFPAKVLVHLLDPKLLVPFFTFLGWLLARLIK